MLESYIKLRYMDFGSLTDDGIIISPARAAHVYWLCARLLMIHVTV